MVIVTFRTDAKYSKKFRFYALIWDGFYLTVRHNLMLFISLQNKNIGETYA